MRTVVIEDMGEYSVRLVRYLERHLSTDMHIVSSSGRESLEELSPVETCLVGGEQFLEEVGSGFDRRIVMGEQEVPGEFCRFHSPADLIALIDACFLQNQEKRGNPIRETVLTAIYMPVFDPMFHHIAMELMEPGELCLGMENMGEFHERTGDMGDLCYYVHLRQEKLSEQIWEMAREEEERYFLDSPCVYYDLLELTEEDIQWFFETLRTQHISGTIYIALGSGFVKNPEIFRQFDRVIVLHSGESERMQSFCHRFRQILEVKQICPRGGVEFLDRELFVG